MIVRAVTVFTALVFSNIEHANGAVMTYTSKTQWQTEVGGNYNTITFDEVPLQTLVTTQYSTLGVLMDGTDQTYQAGAFINDGVGLDGNGPVVLTFITPRLWMGAEYPGPLRIQLFSNNVLFYTSADFGGTVGSFLGLVSTQPFDRAVLIDPLGEAEIDDLYFGPPVPAPGALMVVGLAGALASRRSRREH